MAPARSKKNKAGLLVENAALRSELEKQASQINELTALRSTEMMAAIYRDITDSKRAYQLLEQNERRFRALIEHSTDAIVLLDAQGKVRYESPTVQLLTQYTPEERLNQSALDLIYPADLAQIKLSLDRVLTAPGKVESAIFRQIRKDGTLWWTEGTAANLLDKPEVEAVVINYRDVTGRKQAEDSLNATLQSLRQSEERFAKPFYSSPAAVSISHLGDGLMVNVNDHLRDLLGYSRLKLIGHTMLELNIFPNPQDYARLVQNLRREGSLRNAEIALRSKYGDIRHTLYSAETIEIHGEALILSTIIDISARKRAELALRSSEERYRRLFETIHEAFTIQELVFDENHQPADLCFLEMNQAAERLFARSRQEVIGRTRSEVFGPYSPQDLAELAGVALSGHPLHAEKYSETAGRWFEGFSYSPAPGQVATLALDITERKHAEEQARTLGLRLVHLLARHQLGGKLEMIKTPGALYTITFSSIEQT